MNLTRARAVIDQYSAHILDHGDDDQLFASGYLQGHLDLILCRCEAAGVDFLQFMAEMEHSLVQAYGRNELNQRDRLLVQTCWLELQGRLTTQ